MSSDSYQPAPVRRVQIPKGDGKTRPLGIPTVSDRIALMVVKRHLEAILEPIFHDDSYGYRPRRSAHQALSSARQRCWRYDWVLDLDIKGFFDSIDWTLLMRALRKHTDCKWVLLYIERWLRAPVQRSDGTALQPVRGTPQGAVISPLLANLFLHYAFDRWMQAHPPDIPFERYADDVVCHCSSEAQARGSSSQAAPASVDNSTLYRFINRRAITHKSPATVQTTGTASVRVGDDIIHLPGVHPHPDTPSQD